MVGVYGLHATTPPVTMTTPQITKKSGGLKPPKPIQINRRATGHRARPLHCLIGFQTACAVDCYRPGSRILENMPEVRPASPAALGTASAQGRCGGLAMLETILVLLVVLWLLGMVSSYTLGGFIHVLLVLAVIVFLFRVISGRRAV
jgi:hypothetical protein